MRRLASSSLILLGLACGPAPGVDGGDELGDRGEASDWGRSEGGDEGCPSLGDEVPPLDDPELCAAYFGDTALEHGVPELELEIINERAEAIVLLDQSHGCNQAARWFSLTGEHADRAIWLPKTNCEIDWPACSLYGGEPPVCYGCATFHWPIYIAPGGRLRTRWRAAVAVAVELPASCASEGEALPCWAPTPLPLGDYLLEAQAVTASECPACSCELNEDGSCGVEPSSPDSFPILPPSLFAQAHYDGQSECARIVIRFQPELNPAEAGRGS